MGARRCPGCGTRLVAGVQLTKALLFTVLGLVLGLVVGGAGVGLLGLGRSATPTGPVANAGGSAAPSASAGPSSTPSVTAVPTDVPLLSRTAIVQAVTVNSRLAASARALSVALARKPFDAGIVAQALRTISAESVYATELAAIVSGWPDSAQVGAELTSLYGSVHDSAAAALNASVRNATAYRDAARAMVATLAQLAPVDAEIRALAAARGIDVPAPSAAP